MLYYFGCWDVATPSAALQSRSLFQTGWFVESLVTQTLIIHIIRTNKIPFFQSWASRPLLIMSSVVMMIGILIPSTPFGSYLGFATLPAMYWLFLALLATSYAILTQGVKTWLLRKAWI
jgi:Mg2+-importing ATPase